MESLAPLFQALLTAAALAALANCCIKAQYQ
jgi:hypothetical protein